MAKKKGTVQEPIPGSGGGDPTSGRLTDYSIESYGRGSTRLLGYLLEMMQEGERINQLSPNYKNADTYMKYISGEHDVYKNLPGYTQPVNSNETAKAATFHVSGLTDIKPLFSFGSQNPHFQVQASVFNKYTMSWWAQALAGRELGQVIRYAIPCGSGDLVAEFDPNFLGGETRLFARDPRDQLPLFPDIDYDIQTWEGVIIRETHPISKWLEKYPGMHNIFREGGAMLAFTRRRELFVDRGGMEESLPLEQLSESRAKRQERRSLGYCTGYRAFLRDRSINTSGKVIRMGDPTSNYWYDVQPRQPLYPYGRCIIFTEFGVADDGPNPYWHGMWPTIRIQLQPWPWEWFGKSMIRDLKGGQDAINRVINLMLQNISQHVERGTVWEPSAPASVMSRFDPRQPYWKLRKSNSQQAMMQLSEVATLPPWTFQLLTAMTQKFADIAGVANFQQLLQLRQMPGYEVMDKLMEALTPEMRTEAEQMTFGLRQLSDIFLHNLFQFQSKQKRMDVLGDAGQVISDFDWDPGTVVPALKTGDPGYCEQLDASKPRQERARYFKRLFGFYISPQSLISLLSSGTQMKYMQLSRMGLVDPWTLAEQFGLQNFGPPPNMPLPVMDWKPEPGQPMTPPIEIRQPITILERILAANQLGIGATVNPAGRKASGNQPPHMEQKGDGRQVISES